MASEDSTGQTPDDLSTTDTTEESTPSGDIFSEITNSVITLAGAAQKIVRGQNSPVGPSGSSNSVPSNTPSTVPTAQPSQTSTFAGWSTTKKVVAGVVAGILGLLALMGLVKVFKD